MHMCMFVYHILTTETSAHVWPLGQVSDWVISLDCFLLISFYLVDFLSIVFFILSNIPRKLVVHQNKVGMTQI